MIRHVISLLGLFVFAFGCWAQNPNTAGVAGTQSDQTKDKYTDGGELKKPSAYSGLPVVGEFQETQVEAAPDRERRKIREKRYSVTHQPRPVGDPGLFVDGQSETTNLRFIDYVAVGKSSDPSGIPVFVSSAVVVGTILSGKCFVSADHNYVYTDYQIKVDQILKQDAGAGLSVGDELVAAREGGAVHFPSGHVTNFLTVGHGLPEIGSKYILFLGKPVPSLPEYEIMFDAGYQLESGRVYPLDDVNSKYVGVDVAVFSDEVQKAIAASQNGGVKP
jgi:hypothetical protein